MNNYISFHITLQKPPAGVAYALQNGHGNNFEIAQAQHSTGQDLFFNFTAAIRGNKQKDAAPGFGGPFVQGPSGAKFIYIGIGKFAGQQSGFSRRLKVPLTGITWQMIKDGPEGLETVVPGTAKDGTPTCATVKPFGGWRIKQAEK